MGASETKQTPSGNSPRSSVAIRSARRVLPTPPVPVRVSKRSSGRASRVEAAATSRSRPISDVSGNGRVEERLAALSEASPRSAGDQEASVREREMLRVPGGTRVRLQSMRGRLTLISTIFVLSSQCRCHGIQPLECQLLRLAYIDTVELAVTLAIGAPVRPTALVARLLFARRERAAVVGKGEGGGRTQPGIPGWGSDHQCLLLSILLKDQCMTPDDRSCLCHDTLLSYTRYPAPSLSEQYSTCLESGQG